MATIASLITAAVLLACQIAISVIIIRHYERISR